MDSLRLSEERLRISNNLKEQYYSLLSHDLKSPLKYLRLALETLRDNIHKYSPAAIEKRLHGLYKSTDKIYGLTENFTSWIRAHDSSVKTEPVAVNIPHLLKNIAALYEHMEQTQIKIDAGERLIFCTDPNLMHIVFRNVVDNALKHGNATAIHIRAQEHVDNTLQVRFSNNGHCIPPETLARLNDDTLVPEMQAINNQQSLGYQIIKALTLKLEGTHHISSTHENGTDITFIFKALKSHL
jgi:K+-sensing histidine kinase KdpD